MRLAQAARRSRLTGSIRLAALLAVCGLIACTDRAGTDDLLVEWTLTPDTPSSGEPTLARLTLQEPDGRPVTGARLRIEGHMDHPGMAPVVAPAVERDPGMYEAEIEFTMAGPWTLVASGTLEDGRRLTHTLDVPNIE